MVLTLLRTAGRRLRRGHFAARLLRDPRPLFVLALALAAWSGHAPATAAPATGETFYWYGDQKVVLKRDAGYLTLEDPALAVKAPGGAARALGAVRAALPEGVAPVTRLSKPRRGLWVVRGEDPATLENLRLRKSARRATNASGSAARTYPVFRNPDTGLLVIHVDEITARLAEEVEKTRAERFLAGLGLHLVRRDPMDRSIWLLRAPDAPGDEIFALANRVAAEKSLFRWAEPNFHGETRKTYLPDDPYFANQWHLRNTGQNGGTAGADISAAEAWDATRGDPAIVICHVDDGLDLTHEDLAANVWVNPAEAADGTDTDGNGFVDDQRGWDFYDGDNDVSHDDPVNEGHGTSVAGLSAAVQDNARGVSGVAPRCGLLHCKVFKGENYSSDFIAAAAIRYGASLADVVSCSWGGATPSSDLRDAIGWALVHGRGGLGTLTFAAAGNEYANLVGFPAGQPLAVAVGATNPSDKRNDYSNTGAALNIMAPSGAWTTDISGLNAGYDGGDGAGNYTGGFGGTSAATPVAAGVAALMLSINNGLTAGQTLALLHQTADKVQSADAIYDETGFSFDYGHGRVNAQRAVQALAAPPLEGFDDQFEPNDAFNAAAPIASGFFKGLVSSDEDWFAVPASPGNELTLWLYHPAGRQNLDLQLYDSQGELQASQSTPGDLEEIRFQVPDGLTSSTWYARVHAASYAATGYTLVVATREPDDSFEENDSFEDAPDIDFGAYPDLRCYDADYYRVPVTPGEGVEVTLAFNHAAGDLDLKIIDQDRRTIANADSSTDGEHLRVYGSPTRAAFYVLVYGYEGAINAYSMTLARVSDGPPPDDDYEDNDSIETAAVLHDGTYSLILNDDDWFRVPVPEGGPLSASITFTHANGDLDLAILDQAGEYVASSNSVTGEESATAEGIDGNTIFNVLVYGYEEATNSYSLTLLGAADPATSNTPSPTPPPTATPTAIPPPTPTPPIEPINELIESFYDIVLARPPETGALDAWRQGYFDYAVTLDIDVRFIPREMSRLFFFSEEYQARQRTNDEFIRDCYRVFVGREPNTAELEHWLQGQWLRQEAVSLFANSEEFSNRIASSFPGFEGQPARNFVTVMYIGFLDRLVDADGLAYFAGVFIDGRDRVALAKWMARGILDSEEFLAAAPDAGTYVERLYRAFLGRFPNAQERNYFVGLLEGDQTTVDSLIDVFGDSKEFQERLNRYFAES